ncbi:hypothetical protein C2855_10900 [Aeromonas bestiarum]|nr:hypothetical protein C2855_10900 [Aeromonas bestiarum]
MLRADTLPAKGEGMLATGHDNPVAEAGVFPWQQKGRGSLWQLRQAGGKKEPASIHGKRKGAGRLSARGDE